MKETFELKPGTWVPADVLHELERKVGKAIFGDFERVEDKLIFSGGANRRLFKRRLRGFDVPFIIGMDNHGNTITKRFRLFEQDPNKDSVMGDRARKGEQIMWVACLEKNEWVAYWDKSGRQNIKEERLKRQTEVAAQTKTTKVLR
jgi:hypothetical protein